MKTYSSTACAMCGEPLDPQAKGIFAEVSGWAMNRKAGGSNQISLRHELGRYAHSWCVKLAAKHNSHQEAMF